jgi:hypothetical protein
MDTTPKAAGPLLSRTVRLPLILALVAGLVLNLMPLSVARAAGNDSLGSASSITPPLMNDSTDTTSFTSEAGEFGTCGSFAANNHSAWYQYTPASNGWLTVDTFGSGYDTVLEIFTGASPSFGSLTSVACNDDATGGVRESESTIQVTTGTNYFIVARDYNSGSGGSLNFSASFSTQRQIYVNKITGNDANTGSTALPVKTIQRGVDLVPPGGVVNITAAGTYAESVTINKALTFNVPAGAVTASNFTLQSGAAITLSGAGTITAPNVAVQANAKVQDGVALVSALGTVNVGAGTFSENVTIGKSLTLQSSVGATLHPASGAAVTVSAGATTLIGFNITSASGVTTSGGATVNAARNWWNSASGPTAASNPGGTGSSAGANVSFRPWCTVANPTCNATGGLATKLVFTTQPTNSSVGQVIAPAPVVTAQDALGNADTSFNGFITVAITAGTGTPGATLGGTTTIQVTNGLGFASFSDLSIDKAGLNYRLTATASSLTSATSALFNIGKGNQTITFNALGNKVYGDPPFGVSASATSGLTVVFSSDTPGVCTVSGTTVTIVAPGTCTIRAKQGGNVDWNPAPDVTQSFTVAKASQTITFNALADRRLDQSPLTVSASASSGLTVSFSAAGQCHLSGATTVVLDAIGTCTITASQPGDANWAAAPDVIRSFNITMGDQTITFDPLADRRLDQSPFTLGATASSQLAVQYSAVGQCSVTGSTVTLISVGTCTITASQPGDGNWNAAADVVRSFNITKGDQTITFNALGNKVYGDPPFGVSASASSGLVVSFSSDTPGVCTVSGTTVTIVVPGTCTIRASQGGNADWNAAPDVTQSFTVAKASQTITFGALGNKVYGDPPFGVSASATSGLTVTFSSDTPSVCTVSGTVVSIVGAGTCTIRASQAGDTYWAAAPDVTRSFTVARASATVTLVAASLSATYDGTQHAASATTTPSGLAVQFTYTGTGGTVYPTSSTPPINAGTYTVNASIADPNYQGSTSGTLTISRANGTITLVPASLSATYDGAQHAATATTTPSGLVVRFTYTGTGGTVYPTSSNPPINAGSYTVNATFADPNYQGSASGTLVIAKANQTITFNALANKVYGDPPFAVSARSSSRLAVVLSASGNCMVGQSGGQWMVTITGAGSCTITASQPGNANYNAATPVSRSFTIAKADQTIDFAWLADRALVNSPFTVSASASSGLTVTLTAAGQCTVSGMTVNLTSLGSCTLTASQPGNANYNAATPVVRKFAIVNSFKVFLPVMMIFPKPDLVGSFSLSPNSLAPNQPVTVTVIITNQGDIAASQFWVDFYINPSTPPTDTNQPWNKRCGLTPCYGIAWYITGTLAPGQSMILTSTPDSYFGPNTRWKGKFAEGTSDLYLYVDSWNPGVATGAVEEGDEANNRAEYHLPASSSIGAAPSGDRARADRLPYPDDLPPRPRQP